MTPITVNADNLFRTVGRYFDSPRTALREAIQNVYRAYLPLQAGQVAEIWIDILGGFVGGGSQVTITDRGRGIEDFGSMLSLANSAWDPSVAGQDPAGMGVAGLLQFADEVTWRSRGRSITVNSEAYFNSPAYRANLTDQPCLTSGETSVTLHRFRHLPDDVMRELRTLLPPFPLKATVTLGGDREAIKTLPYILQGLPVAVQGFEDDNQTPAYTAYVAEGSNMSELGTSGHAVAILDGHIYQLGRFLRPTPYRFLDAVDQGTARSLDGLGGDHLIVVLHRPGVLNPVLPARRDVQEDEALNGVLAALLSRAATQYAERFADEIRGFVGEIMRGSKWPSSFPERRVREMGPAFRAWVGVKVRDLFQYRDLTATDISGGNYRQWASALDPVDDHQIVELLPWEGGSYGESLSPLKYAKIHVAVRAQDDFRLLGSVTPYLAPPSPYPEKVLVVDTCGEVGHPQYSELDRNWKPAGQPIRAWVVDASIMDVAVDEETAPWDITGAIEIELEGVAWADVSSNSASLPQAFCQGSLEFAQQAIEVWREVSEWCLDDGDEHSALSTDCQRLLASLSQKVEIRVPLAELRDALGWDGVSPLTVDPQEKTVTFTRNRVECREVYR